MSERGDLLGRLTELDAGTETNRATARSIQKMINHGDYAAAADALDDLETSLHPALAAGGGDGESFNGGTITEPLTIDLEGQANTPGLIVLGSDGSVVFDAASDGTGESQLETPTLAVGRGDVSVFLDDELIGYLSVRAGDSGEATLFTIGPVGDVTFVQRPAANLTAGVKIVTDPLSGNFYAFAIQDDQNAIVFGITQDGTVHIKTGTSIVADL